MKLHAKLPDAILQEFLPRCRSCYGLCCVALARSIPDGFPETRLPGEPCSFLQPDFRCAIHAELSARGLFGCETYHCLGAGQMVSGLFSSGSWRLADSPDEAREIYQTFLLGEGLKLTLWYLAEAGTLLPVQELWASRSAVFPGRIFSSMIWRNISSGPIPFCARPGPCCAGSFPGSPGAGLQTALAGAFRAGILGA